MSRHEYLMKEAWDFKENSTLSNLELTQHERIIRSNAFWLVHDVWTRISKYDNKKKLYFVHPLWLPIEWFDNQSCCLFPPEEKEEKEEDIL